MAGTNPNLIVKIGANIDALKAALAMGQTELIKTAAGATALASSLNGQKLEQNALQMAVAIKAVGGAATLTAAEAKKADAAFTAWFDKAAKTGKDIPPQMAKLAEEVKKVAAAATDAGKAAATGEGFFSRMASTFAGFVSAQAVLRVVGSAFGFVKDAVIEMNSSLETTTLQFTTMMGDADKAKAHVQRLFEFAAKTPFETGPIIQASRYLRLFGGDALDTAENLKRVGDAAATSGQPINEVGMWVARLYSGLKAGQPVGEATQRLMEMGVMSGQVRAKVAELAAGVEGGRGAWEYYSKELDKNNGAMEKMASTWAGVTSTFKDTITMTLATAFKPLFDRFRDLIGQVNTIGGSKALQDWASRTAVSIDNLTISAVGFGASIAPVVGFIGQEFNAVQVLFRNLMQVIDLALLGVKGLALAALEAADYVTPGGAFLEQRQRIRAEMGALVVAIDQRKVALQEDKKAEEEWAQTGVRLAKTLADTEARMRANQAAILAKSQATVADTKATADNAKGNDEWAKSAKNAEKAAKDAEAATSKWLDDWAKKTQAGRDAKLAFQDSFKRLGSTMIQVLSETGTAGKQFEFLKWQIQGVRDTIASKFMPLMPALKGNLTGVKDTAKGLGETFVALGDVFQNINSKVGQSFQIIGGAITAIKKASGDMGQQLVVGFSAAAAVVQQFAGATVVGAMATGALSGAAAGASLAMLKSIGLSTTLGAAFMGVGAAVGALIGVYGALRAEQARVNAQNETALKNYEALRRELLAIVGTMDDLQNVAAAIGDVTANGQDLAEVIAYLDSHPFSGTAKLEYFADAYEAFKRKQAELLKSVTEGTKLATQELLDYMAVAAQVSGELAKTARDYYLAQLGSAATGLTAMLEGLQKGATLSAQAAAIALHKAAGMSEAEAKKAADGIVGVFVKTQAQATGLGASIAATFANMIKQGATFREALEAIKGPLDTLRKQLELTGLKGGAAFENLSRMGQIASGEITGPLSDAITGANAALQGLHNAGILNQEMFTGIAGSATDAYKQILAQGADGQAALMMMQPTLQTIWKLQQDFGYEVDAATQALLEEAVASGIVGEAQMTDAQKQTAALEGIRGAVEQLVVLFGGTLPESIGRTRKAVEDAAGSIDGRMQTLIARDWTLDVNVQYNDEGYEVPNPTPFSRGGVVYAASGWTARGTDIVPAMLTPGERVLTVAQNRAYEETLRQPGYSSAPAPVNVSITIQALDPAGLKQVVEKDVAPLLVSAYRRNVNGLRTETRKELVE